MLLTVLGVVGSGLYLLDSAREERAKQSLEFAFDGQNTLRMAQDPAAWSAIQHLYGAAPIGSDMKKLSVIAALDYKRRFPDPIAVFTPSGPANYIALNSSGTLCAVATEKSLEIYEVASAKRIASTELAGIRSLVFQDELLACFANKRVTVLKVSDLSAPIWSSPVFEEPPRSYGLLAKLISSGDRLLYLSDERARIIKIDNNGVRLEADYGGTLMAPGADHVDYGWALSPNKDLLVFASKNTKAVDVTWKILDLTLKELALQDFDKPSLPGLMQSRRDLPTRPFFVTQEMEFLSQEPEGGVVNRFHPGHRPVAVAKGEVLGVDNLNQYVFLKLPNGYVGQFPIYDRRSTRPIRCFGAQGQQVKALDCTGSDDLLALAFADGNVKVFAQTPGIFARTLAGLDPSTTINGPRKLTFAGKLAVGLNIHPLGHPCLVSTEPISGLVTREVSLSELGPSLGLNNPSYNENALELLDTSSDAKQAFLAKRAATGDYSEPANYEIYEVSQGAPKPIKRRSVVTANGVYGVYSEPDFWLTRTNGFVSRTEKWTGSTQGAAQAIRLLPDPQDHSRPDSKLVASFGFQLQHGSQGTIVRGEDRTVVEHPMKGFGGDLHDLGKDLVGVAWSDGTVAVCARVGSAKLFVAGDLVDYTPMLAGGYSVLPDDFDEDQDAVVATGQIYSEERYSVSKEVVLMKNLQLAALGFQVPPSSFADARSFGYGVAALVLAGNDQGAAILCKQSLEFNISESDDMTRSALLKMTKEVNRYIQDGKSLRWTVLHRNLHTLRRLAAKMDVTAAARVFLNLRPDEQEILIHSLNQRSRSQPRDSNFRMLLKDRRFQLAIARTRISYEFEFVRRAYRAARIPSVFLQCAYYQMQEKNQGQDDQTVRDFDPSSRIRLFTRLLNKARSELPRAQRVLSITEPGIANRQYSRMSDGLHEAGRF
ncbi:MAG: hypothetical protein U0931_41420 [Vulcanimicrobiota bacterium]